MTPAKLKELQRLMQEGDSEEVPSGWMCRQDVAIAFKRSQVQTDKILSDLLKRGLVQRKMIRRPTKSGVRQVPFFFFPPASVSSAKASPKQPRRKR